jgi:hypothetical protein
MRSKLQRTLASRRKENQQESGNELDKVLSEFPSAPSRSPGALSFNLRLRQADPRTYDGMINMHCQPEIQAQCQKLSTDGQGRMLLSLRRMCAYTAVSIMKEYREEYGGADVGAEDPAVVRRVLKRIRVRNNRPAGCPTFRCSMAFAQACPTECTLGPAACF